MERVFQVHFESLTFPIFHGKLNECVNPAVSTSIGCLRCIWALYFTRFYLVLHLFQLCIHVASFRMYQYNSHLGLRYMDYCNASCQPTRSVTAYQAHVVVLTYIYCWYTCISCAARLCISPALWSLTERFAPDVTRSMTFQPPGLALQSARVAHSFISTSHPGLLFLGLHAIIHAYAVNRYNDHHRLWFGESEISLYIAHIWIA